MVTSLTTYQTIQYALRPNSSEYFETLAKEFPFNGNTTELGISRTVFYGGLFTIIVGGLSMLTIDNPSKCVPVVAIGTVIYGVGSLQLSRAAQRVQGLWELNSLLQLIEKKGL
jgi:hypothetical protein